MTVKTKKMQVCFLKSKFSFLIKLRSKRLNSKPKSKKFPNSSTIFRTHSRLLKIFKPRFLPVKSLKMVKHLLNLPVQCLWEKALLMKKKSMQKMKNESKQKQKLLSQKMKKESKNLQNPKVLLRKGKRPKPKKMLWKNQKRINKPRPKLHNQRSKILIRKKKMLLKASSKILIRKPKKKALKKIKSGPMKNSSLDL